jgi:hypothetical protein
LLADAWTPGAGLRLLGFGVSGFAEHAEQLDLLAESASGPDERARSLVQSIDAVKARFGEQAISFGHADQREPDD